MNGNGHGYLRQAPRVLPYELERRRARVRTWRRRLWLWPLIGAFAGGLVGWLGALLRWW